MARTDQPAREENINTLVSFFESGIKSTDDEIGIELEHIIVKDDLSPVLFKEEHGIKWLLEQIDAQDPPRYVPLAFSDIGGLLGLQAPDWTISLEPGAQIELACNPFTHLADAEVCLNEFEELLAFILEPVGLRAITVGYHPSAHAREMRYPLKNRYKLMDSYFESLPGQDCGLNMMYCTASTQISINYTSTQDCLRKLRLACALSPLFALMCDNSPIYEGTIRNRHMVRSQIWQKCDPDRCGIVPGVMKDDFTLYDYANYILDTPAIVASADDKSSLPERRTFGELYATNPMSITDVDHVVSMFFNDVRLKKYIEIRPADAMPVPYAIAYAALIKGIFSSKDSMNTVETLFLGTDEDEISREKNSLIENGYEALIGDMPAYQLANLIIKNAYSGLSDEEIPYLKPLADLVSKRTTLAQLATEHMT